MRKVLKEVILVANLVSHFAIPSKKQENILRNLKCFF